MMVPLISVAMIANSLAASTRVPKRISDSVKATVNCSASALASSRNVVRFRTTKKSRRLMSEPLISTTIDFWRSIDASKAGSVVALSVHWCSASESVA
ncbi:hypothetical protein D3C76_1248480 [compost metagenome]